jgi:hypothetical protein
MKVYTVHIDPDNRPPQGEPEFIREGFHLWGFIFGNFWLLYQRLWWQFGVVTAANVAVAWMPVYLGLHEISTAVIQIAINVWVGIEGNDWLRDKLKRQGYIVADIVTGDSDTVAELRFYERYLKA